MPCRRDVLFCIILFPSLWGCGTKYSERGPSPVTGANAAAAASMPSPTPTISTASIQIAMALNNLEWVLPCAVGNGLSCTVDPVATAIVTTLSWDPNTTYAVGLHFRGIVETTIYDCSDAQNAQSGYWVQGCKPRMFDAQHQDPFNVYSLQISDPANIYYLNSGQIEAGPPTGVVYIDYTQSVLMKGNALITLNANSVDGWQIVPPAIDTFMTTVPSDLHVISNAQFIQMTVVNVTPQ